VQTPADKKLFALHPKAEPELPLEQLSVNDKEVASQVVHFPPAK